MAPEWTAEIDVTPSEAGALIEGQFPELAPLQIESLGVGWDNSAFRVNRRYVFRFPRRQFAVQFLEAESRLLPRIAPRLPLPIPCPEYSGRSTDTFPWPFLGHRMLAGRTACAVALDDEQRLLLAAPLARFLQALHAIPALEVDAITDAIARLDLSRRIPWAKSKLNQLLEGRLIEDPEPYAKMLDTAPMGYVPRTDTVTHGDLYIRHLLVDSSGRLAGIIDWGDAHRGDPAIDLAIAFSILPPAARQAFFDEYGPVDDLTLQVARLRALWHTLVLVLYSHDIGDQNLLREARIGLEYIAAS